MSRRLAAEDFRTDEVSLYRQTDLDDAPIEPETALAESSVCRSIALESLDGDENPVGSALQVAQDKAQEVIAAATAKADEIRQEARQAGLAQAREDALAELLPTLTAFASAGQALIDFEQRFVTDCAPQLVALALEIAEKIIAKEVLADEQIVASVLERAKQELLVAKQIRIWLHPDDHRLLAKLRPELVQTVSQAGRSVEVVESEEIARGGCRLETESGVLDATLETQLGQVRRELLETEL